jgi:hypothetical protein
VAEAAAQLHVVVVVRDAVPARARPEVPLGADLPHHAGDHQQRRDDAQHHQHRRVRPAAARRALRMRERRRGGGGHRRWIRSSLASSSQLPCWMVLKSGSQGTVLIISCGFNMLGVSLKVAVWVHGEVWNTRAGCEGKSLPLCWHGKAKDQMRV